MDNEELKQESEISRFEKELENLINRFSIENESGTPDFILAKYVRGCLDSFSIAVNRRDVWHKKD